MSISLRLHGEHIEVVASHLTIQRLYLKRRGHIKSALTNPKNVSSRLTLPIRILNLPSRPRSLFRALSVAVILGVGAAFGEPLIPRNLADGKKLPESESPYIKKYGLNVSDEGLVALLYLSDGGELFVRGHGAFKKLGGVFFKIIDDAKNELERLGHDFTLPLKHENAFGGEGEPDFPALEAATTPMDDAYWDSKEDPPHGAKDVSGAILQYVQTHREKLKSRRA